LNYPRVVSFVLFVGLCSSSTYWVIQFYKPIQRAVIAPPPLVQKAPDIEAAYSFFGYVPSANLTSNFKLKGILFSNRVKDSVAMLTFNGNMQKVHIGTELSENIKVNEITQNWLIILDNGMEKKIELPKIQFNSGRKEENNENENNSAAAVYPQRKVRNR
jgi:general secretion pathway protein C